MHSFPPNNVHGLCNNACIAGSFRIDLILFMDTEACSLNRFVLSRCGPLPNRCWRNINDQPFRNNASNGHLFQGNCRAFMYLLHIGPRTSFSSPVLIPR